MFNKTTSKPNFFNLEQEILAWWKENKILEKSIEQRPEDNMRTFYDGPITANGAPHIGHALTFSMKDIIPRYWTMKGYRVSRSIGWDCQGLPVEYEVEKQLGFKEKKEIENFGIAEFNKLCRQLVTDKRGQIINLEEMMGRLTNNEEEYATMDKDYIESIWWSLKELHNKGLLYEGFKVVPYSTRAGTTLSNAEVALGGYKPFVDPAITVKFALKDEEKTFVLAWTTTPWTIPSNLGLAINKSVTYVKVKVAETSELYILAKDLVDSVFKDKNFEIVLEVSANELIGKEYTPPFNFFAGRENAHKIYDADYVSTDSGTGVVHLAPYGAEDNEVFQKVGIKSFDVLNDQGDFTKEVPDYEGLNYRDANPKIIEDLKSKNLLFNLEDYEHEMPMCWRTNTPLIYKPITSWYIAMSTLRNELVENNSKINWNPSHIKEGRFGNWLAEIKDWAISRSRYWGTPLPVWKSPSNKVIVIGSFEELKKYSGADIEDPHRPFIDDITFEFEGEKYTRVLDVIDVWYDSGAMPFARFHYPFENQEKFKKKFPAKYIAEGVDQTRGWFYSLIAISTALFGTSSYENVIVNGTILDDNGAKLSKSKKNYVDPELLVKEFGADTIRANFFMSPISSGEDATVSQKTLKTQAQEFTLPLWNVFTYFVTYANIHNWIPRAELAYNMRKNFTDEHPWDHIPFDNIEDEIDAWLILKLQKTIKTVVESIDSFEIPRAARSIKDLVDDISKWFIRRSRERFAEGNVDSLDTLYYVLIETTKLLAPFTPFISEYIYRELVATHIPEVPESVHLTDYPEVDPRFLDEYQTLESEMNFVKRITEMAHTLRTTQQLKVRQPLSKLHIVNLNQEVAGIVEWMSEMIKSEINVKDVLEVPSFVKSADLVEMEDSSMNVTIALDINLTPELVEEGTIRDLIRQIQALRKDTGFEQGELIKISFESTDETLVNAIRNNEGSVKKGVSAVSIDFSDSLKDNAQEISFDNKKVKIAISKNE
jgi:isoleucyl-tRNA synthetase